MHRFIARPVLVALAILCTLALGGRSALAAPAGLEVAAGAGHDLLVTGLVEAGNYTFEYDPTCSDDASFGGKPCYAITAGQGMVGVPIAASGCTARMGNGYTPSAVKCAASGVTGVTIVLKHGGTLSIPAISSHPGTACSPAPVTVKTGSGSNVLSLNDGCHETINCAMTGTAGFSGGDIDAGDSVLGKCGIMIRH
jgi:hypothetical protein